MRNHALTFARRLNNRHLRIAVMMAVDAAIVAFSLLLAFWLRFDFTQEYRIYDAYLHRFEFMPWLVAIRWLCGWAANIYRWSFSHASLQEGAVLILSALAGTIIFFALCRASNIAPAPLPRSIYAVEATFTMAGMLFFRFFPKYVFLIYRSHSGEKAVGKIRKPVIIYGAGGNAETLARELARTNIYPFEPVGFVDDDRDVWGVRIHGLKVLGGVDKLPGLIDKLAVREILVAIPNLSGEPLRRLIDICGPKNVRFKIIPPYPSVLTPGAMTRMIEDIKPENLLERKLVKFDRAKINKLLGGKTVLITGAAGTIGGELCRQTAAEGIGKLVLLDFNENELYFLGAELREKYPELDIRVSVGSVRDRERLDAIMSRHRPHLVFHAAAHKHVPLMENSPCEAIKNNVIGTFEAAESALLHGAESFTLISSDKAVASANVMGASKALAEHIVRDIAGRGAMRCPTVRFGNVLGSNGSLLQIVRRQIAAGGPVTVTHRDMTRYFMAIPEAVALVLMATALDEGQTYVLDMGKQINIDRLVRQIVMLAGMTPDRDIEIRYTRPRAGEKLYEKLCSGSETLAKSSFPRINVVSGGDKTPDIASMLAEARQAAEKNDNRRARDFFKTWMTDFTP